MRSVIHRSSCAHWQCNHRDSWCIHWQSHLVCRDCMVLSSYDSGNAGITVAGQDWAVWSTEHLKRPMPDFARLLFLIVGSHFLWVQYHQRGVCVCIAISHVNPCNVRSKDSESQSGASQESQVSSLRTSELSNIWRYLETSAEDC